MAEQSVEEDFGVQGGQVLEVAQGDALGAPAVDLLEMLADVLVIARQVGGGNLDLTAAGNQMVIKITAPVCPEALADSFGVLE